MPPKAETPYWENDLFKAYANSNYTYDDAELLASLWNIDIIDAKKTIGYKVTNKLEHLLPEKLRGGSGGADSDWHDGGKVTANDQLDAFFKSNYTYEDAELLSQLWNTDILEAKKTIGNKIIYGWEKYLPEKIQSGSGDKFEEDGYDLEALGMFVLSPYTYDDADQLAQLWEIEVIDAKEIIGIKILNGDEKLLPDKIRRDEEPGC